MNKDTFKGHWKEIKGKIQQKWGKLTDDDVAQMNGSLEELEGKLQKNYGYRKEEVTKEINQFIRENHLDDEGIK